MIYLSFLWLWAGMTPAAVSSDQASLVVSEQGPQEGLTWYTVTAAGVLDDRVGAYCLSGCISQSPVSTPGYVDAGMYYIIGGFWSSEFDAKFSRNRDEIILSSLKPGAFRLYRNSPNPFRRATRIAYDLPVRSRVGLSIYDVNGRLVRKLVECRQDVGRHSLNWDGKDKKGRTCPTGVYFCSLKTEDSDAVGKMIIAE
jgi:hypothetical protein